MNTIYKQRILTALTYIESNLAQPLNLDVVSNHCHFSPFHFHRIFSGVMNETLNNYVGRKRLEKAVNLLVFRRELSITNIAFDCGFSSSANFAKSVKKYFGYSPTEIRSPKPDELPNIGNIFSKYGKKFNPNELYPSPIDRTLQNNNKINVEVKTIERKRLCKLGSKSGYESESLFETWDILNDWAELQGIPEKSQYRLAWCYDNPSLTAAHKCQYEASIEIDDKVIVNQPFGVGDLPEGKYAVLYVKGSPEDISQAQLYLFGCWLPDSGFEPDNLPMLERYLNDVRVDGFLESEIMLRLKVLT